MREDLTQERIRAIENRWKSDVDSKLDALVAAEKRRSEKYDAFIDMLIKRELNREKLNSALIEKTLGGAVWGALVFLSYAVWSYVKDHAK